MSENKYNPDYDDKKFLNTIYVGKRRDWNGRYVERTRIDCVSAANHDLIRRLNKPGPGDSII